MNLKSLHEGIPLDSEKRGVKSVCVINKFLKVFIANLGSERIELQILDEAIETVGPEANDYVVLVGERDPLVTTRPWAVTV